MIVNRINGLGVERRRLARDRWMAASTYNVVHGSGCDGPPHREVYWRRARPAPPTFAPSTPTCLCVTRRLASPAPAYLASRSLFPLRCSRKGAAAAARTIGRK